MKVYYYGWNYLWNTITENELDVLEIRIKDGCFELVTPQYTYLSNLLNDRIFSFPLTEKQALKMINKFTNFPWLGK